MNICIGHWNSTPDCFSPDTAPGDMVEREARAQAARLPHDPCVGVHALEDFERAFNGDARGDYELDPAFYWIRFTKGEK